VGPGANARFNTAGRTAGKKMLTDHDGPPRSPSCRVSTIRLATGCTAGGEGGPARRRAGTGPARSSRARRPLAAR